MVFLPRGDYTGSGCDDKALCVPVGEVAVPDEFDDLNLPLGDFDSLPSDGMPDPLAEIEPLAEAEPEPAPTGKKSKKAKPPKKAKAAKKTAAPKPKAPAGPRLGLKASLASANPYTVMLAISLVAVLVAVLCLVLEWGSYGFERNARVSAATTNAARPAVCCWTAADCGRTTDYRVA